MEKGQRNSKEEQVNTGKKEEEEFKIKNNEVITIGFISIFFLNLLE